MSQGLLGDLFAFIDRNKRTVAKRGMGGLLSDATLALDDEARRQKAAETGLQKEAEERFTARLRERLAPRYDVEVTIGAANKVSPQSSL